MAALLLPASPPVLFAADKDAPTTPSAQTASSPRAAGYPAVHPKQLYATDFRGHLAPQLTVEKWLTARPDTTGKVVLIDFWATWCGPCREAIPELNQLQKSFKDDLVVIGVSDEKEAAINKFKTSVSMDYALAIDTKAVTNKKYGIAGIPNVVILSTDGIVRWQGFPLSPQERLTPMIVKQIIDADPGVAKRKAAAAKAKTP